MTAVIVDDADLRTLLQAAQRVPEWTASHPATNAVDRLSDQLCARMGAGVLNASEPGPGSWPLPVALSPAEAIVTAYALLNAVAGSDYADSATWHGGVGPDLCEGCVALIKVRALTGVAIADSIRP